MEYTGCVICLGTTFRAFIEAQSDLTKIYLMFNERIFKNLFMVMKYINVYELTHFLDLL